ncbi:hypothetical protein [Acidovorax sp. ACV01]|uniref:hypothetical protein n=1 Tax=Acidovorax sp. ACV01 TaxID=2769311 RepID=UPI00177D9689|nr:hypothetical protein [Acidovorax sp. ACV01]MBD9395167.1 hypothetical protein [Acidovorax sp. ACV01]
MHHTGTLYMSKQRPTVNTERDGAFRLELVLVDNMGRNPHTGFEEKEAYRVRWAGADAQAFWAEHRANLTAGTPLHVELERLRAHPGPQAYPPVPELRGRVLRLQMLPRRVHHTPQAATQSAAAAA